MHKTVYNKRILLLLTAIFFNAVGMGVIQLYSLIYIYSVTNSNFYTALDGAIFFGSGVVASYFYARYKRNDSLMLYMLIGELVCFSAISVLAYKQTLFLMYACLMVISSAYGFFKPSYQAIIYQITYSSDITRINNTSSMLVSVALALSWISSPLCFAVLDYRGLFFFAAMTHIVSCYFILVVKAMPNKHLLLDSKPTERGNCESLRLYSIVLLVASIAIIRSAIESLEMGIFKKSYCLSDTLVGAFLAIWIFGGVTAGLVNRFFNRKLPKNIWFLRISALIFMLTSFVFSFSKSCYSGACVYFVFGASYYFFDVISNDSIYQKTAKEEHAYHFAIKNLVLNGVMLIFNPALGYIADTTSIPAAIYIAAGISFLLVILEFIRRGTA